MHLDSWCWNVFAPSTTKESGSGNGSWGQPISERVKRSMRWSPGQVTTKKRDEKILSLTGRALFVCQNCRALQLIWSFFSIKASEPSNFNQWLAHHSHMRLAWPTDGRLLQGSPSSFSISQEHDLGHRSGFCHGQYFATCCPTCCIDSNTEAIANISKSRFSRLWLSVAQDSGTAHGAKHKTFPANPSSSHRSKSWSSRRHKKPLRRTCRDKRDKHNFYNRTFCCKTTMFQTLPRVDQVLVAKTDLRSFDLRITTQIYTYRRMTAIIGIEPYSQYPLYVSFVVSQKSCNASPLLSSWADTTTQK